MRMKDLLYHKKYKIKLLFLSFTKWRRIDFVTKWRRIDFVTKWRRIDFVTKRRRIDIARVLLKLLCFFCLVFSLTHGVMSSGNSICEKGKSAICEEKMRNAINLEAPKWKGGREGEKIVIGISKIQINHFQCLMRKVKRTKTKYMI